MPTPAIPRTPPQMSEICYRSVWAVWTNQYKLAADHWDRSPNTLQEVATTTFFSRENPGRELGDAEYLANQEFFDTLIKNIVKWCHENDPQCRFTIISDRDHYKVVNGRIVKRRNENGELVKVKEGPLITKVCRSDRRRAIDKMKFKVSVGNGAIASAIADNHHFNLGQNVPKLVIDGLNKKLEQKYPSIPADQREHLALEMSAEAYVRYGEDIGRRKAASDFVAYLNGNADIKEIDHKTGDEYSKEARAFGETKREDKTTEPEDKKSDGK